MDKLVYKLELPRIIFAITFSLVGIVLSVVLVIYLFSSEMTASNDFAAVVGIFTGITGVLVGTFLGVHIGSSGKEQERAEHRKENVMKDLALGVPTDSFNPYDSCSCHPNHWLLGSGDPATGKGIGELLAEGQEQQSAEPKTKNKLARRPNKR